MDTPEKCKFCSLKDERIFENQFFFSVLDALPISPGHALIIPKRHILSILDLNEKEWAGLKEAIAETIQNVESLNLEKEYIKIINLGLSERSILLCKKILAGGNLRKKPDGYNIGVNDGIAAGRTVHHLHVHIIPRHFGDISDPKEGIRNILNLP
jgi:diadenosine tetraphosphate (Ap4A) HIT family hydrolase